MTPPLATLIDDIEQSHHAYTREALTRIAALAQTVLPAQAAPLRPLLEALEQDLLPHLMKEEQILFPYIKALETHPEHPPQACFGSVAHPIRMMQAEHRAAETLLSRLRALTANYDPRGDARLQALYAALHALDADLREHIRQEDEQLFPSALDLERESVRQ